MGAVVRPRGARLLAAPTAKHLVVDADVIEVLVELEERRLAAVAASGGKKGNQGADADAVKQAQIDGTVRNAGSGRMLHFVSLTNMDATGPRYLHIHDCTDVPNGVTALTDEACARYIAAVMVAVSRRGPGGAEPYFDFVGEHFSTYQVMAAVLSTAFPDKGDDGSRLYVLDGQMQSEVAPPPPARLVPSARHTRALASAPLPAHASHTPSSPSLQVPGSKGTKAVRIAIGETSQAGKASKSGKTGVGWTTAANDDECEGLPECPPPRTSPTSPTPQLLTKIAGDTRAYFALDGDDGRARKAGAALRPAPARAAAAHARHRLAAALQDDRARPQHPDEKIVVRPRRRPKPPRPARVAPAEPSSALRCRR